MNTHLLSRLEPYLRWGLPGRMRSGLSVSISIVFVMLIGRWDGRFEVWAQDMANHPPRAVAYDAQVRGALAGFEDAWPEVQSQALSILDELEALEQLPDSAIPHIGKLLKYPDDAVRLAAIRACGNLGMRAVPFLPDIAAFLAHPNAELQAAAITALGKAGKGREDVYIPQLAPLLEAQNFSLRLTTLYALRNLDPGGQSYLPMIVDGLTHPESRLRAEAVMLLESLGTDAAPYVSRIGALLHDTDAAVQVEALKLLGAFGEIPADIRTQIVALVDSKDFDVQLEAIRSLGKLRPLEETALQKLVSLLHHKRAEFRAAAIMSITAIIPDHPEYIHDLVESLHDHESRVRMAALQALGQLGSTAKPSLSEVRPLLADPEWEIRAAAVSVLGRLGQVDQAVIPEIKALLHDQDWFVRLNAVRAIGFLLQTDETAFDEFALLLADEHENVRVATIETLGNLGERANVYSGQLIALLAHPSPNLRAATSVALRKIGVMGIESLPALLQAGYADPGRTAEIRVLAHLVGAGNADAEWLLRWTGNPGENYPDLSILSPESARESLYSFDAAWAGTIQFPEILNELTRQSAKIIGQMRGQWHTDDILLLQQYTNHFEVARSPLAQSLKMQVLQLKIQQAIHHPIFVATILGVLHPIIWLGLILAYPYAASIRAIFFWNPYVRKIAGLWYIQVALVNFPGLRQRLFQPFRQTLLSDAALEHFDDASYFKESQVLPEAAEETLAIHKAIPEIQGRIVLTGESGVGKTMFARYLMKYATRATVYLPAEKCAEGIVSAIQPKLRGEAQDVYFLKELVRAGALDLCVDGLDALSAQHQVQVTRFLAHGCKGNVLVTARTADWNPPASFQTYQLQPLPQRHIQEFLKNCYRMLPEQVPVSHAEYVAHCKQYLERIIIGQVVDDVVTPAQQVLTNPMGLTLVACVLAYGREPDLVNLVEQVYHLMRETYQRLYHGSLFPLIQFAERVYMMRLNEEATIPHRRFVKEIACLEQYHMVLSRHSFDSYGNGVLEYFFRHEKIMEFFIAQAFVNSPHHRIEKHRDDPRFHNVAVLVQSSVPHEERKEHARVERVMGSARPSETIFERV